MHPYTHIYSLYLLTNVLCFKKVEFISHDQMFDDI
jgi:hypothetical protein